MINYENGFSSDDFQLAKLSLNHIIPETKQKTQSEGIPLITQVPNGDKRTIIVI